MSTLDHITRLIADLDEEQAARQLGVKLDTLQQDARRRGRQDMLRRLGRSS